MKTISNVDFRFTALSHGHLGALFCTNEKWLETSD